MSSNWILASECPHCGGRMCLNSYYSFSRDYCIGKNGKAHKQSKKSPEGPMDVSTAFCKNCGIMWDANNTMVDNGFVYILGEGEMSY